MIINTKNKNLLGILQEKLSPWKIQTTKLKLTQISSHIWLQTPNRSLVVTFLFKWEKSLVLLCIFICWHFVTVVLEFRNSHFTMPIKRQVRVVFVVVVLVLVLFCFWRGDIASVVQHLVPSPGLMVRYTPGNVCGIAILHANHVLWSTEQPLQLRTFYLFVGTQNNVSKT